MTLKVYFKEHLRLIDGALKRILPGSRLKPGVVHAAMRYSVMGNGKRFRPILLLAAAEAVGGKVEDALLPAVAVELIHTYSLIHDDLPCMDNDDLRRGKPSCHKKFGEAYAVLAGDALLTLAFEVLTQVRQPKMVQRLAAVLARAAGTAGMIGGQAADKWYEGKNLDLATLTYIHVHKTGQLIKAAATMGAISAEAKPDVESQIRRYGEYLGLAFQIVDDVLDRDGYVRVMSMSEARAKAGDLITKACAAVAPLGEKGKRLQEISEFVLRRKN